jgi:hypothetical protein
VPILHRELCTKANAHAKTTTSSEKAVLVPTVAALRRASKPEVVRISADDLDHLLGVPRLRLDAL